MTDNILTPLLNPNPNPPQRVRSGSISGRLRSASELEEKGLIDRVQKGALKDLILSGDEQLLAALDKFAVEGDAQELKALLRSGLLEGQHAEFDLDLLVDDLDLNFLQLTHSLGTELGDGPGDAYVQFHMDDVASFLVGEAPLPAATAVAAASASGAASASASPGAAAARSAAPASGSSSGAAAAAGNASAAAAGAMGAAGAVSGGKQQQQQQQQQQQRLQQQAASSLPQPSPPQHQPGSVPSSLLTGDDDLLAAMADRVAGTLGMGRSLSPTNASNMVAFGVSPFEAGSAGALAGLFIKEEPPTEEPQQAAGAASGGSSSISSLAASLMPKAAAGGGSSVPTVTVKTQPPSGGGSKGATPAKAKAGGGAGSSGSGSGGKTSPGASAPVAIGGGAELDMLEREREEGKEYIGAYSPESRRKRLERFWEKKKSRIWDRKVKYDVRKNFADSRIRVKGRFVKKEDEAILLEVSTLTSKEPDATASSAEAAAAGELAALMGDDALAALEGIGIAHVHVGGRDADEGMQHELPPSPPSPPSAPSPPGSPVIPALGL